ncbi:hypothetical protein ACN42_g4386 [Penicillium freii]|uniref:Myb-like DNA-binding domain-containing protein n=1 Tax=Penicillium freii TaxID=48697 RepID=A0A101MLG5_PENFR|nr:hypothetical protein ACN42_g4386 [Penicillium freii]
MGQRNKVLETDTPTAKFLYTIIKQLDLKSVDWNRVASDVEVSNGHAARMRYSRFRQQMEGTTGASRPKRKSKKAKTMEPPLEMQGVFPMAPPLMMPTMEPIDSSLSGNPFVKCEPGTEGNNPNLQSLMQHSPQFMSETSTQGQYYFPQDFASMQFQLASNIPPRIPSPIPTSSSFMNPYQFSTAPAVYPYSSASTQSVFDLREFDQMSSFTNYAPSINWEPRPPSRQEVPTVKVEEEEQTEQGIPNWDMAALGPKHEPSRGFCYGLVVNLALVGKDFGYSSGKSFQKKYAKLKKAYNLTNGHIYGDYRPGKSSTKAATPEAFTPETLTPEAATPEATRTPPKKTTKKFEDTLTPEVKGYLRAFIIAWAQALKERDEQERDDMKKGKSSGKKKRRYILPKT